MNVCPLSLSLNSKSSLVPCLVCFTSLQESGNKTLIFTISEPHLASSEGDTEVSSELK